MSKVVPLRENFQSVDSVLDCLRHELTDVTGFVAVAFRRDGTMEPLSFNVSHGDLAFAGVVLQKLSTDGGEVG